MPEIDLKPLPPEEAVKFFRDKGYAFSFNWKDMWQEEHGRAFTVAKAMRLDILQDIRQSVDKALADGITFEQFRKELTPILQKKNWWGRQTMTDPKTGETIMAQLGSPRRLRIIYDTNLRMARAAGRWEAAQRLKKRRPFLRYTAVLDSRTRPEHRAWHNTVLPVDHPFWQTHYPPNGWNCFPAETVVRCAAKLGLKAWYAGEMVELHTALGHRLTVTANHPVLTSRGWIGAHMLQKGDKLIGASGDVDAALHGIVDNEHPPARAEDLFEALAAEGLRIAPMASDDFHGDARFMESKVHIAGADGALMHIVKAARRKLIRESGFQAALHRGIEATDVAVSAPQTAAVIGDAMLAQNTADGRLCHAEPSRDGGAAHEPRAVKGQDLALGFSIARIGGDPGGLELPLDTSRRAFDRPPFHLLGGRTAAQGDARASERAGEGGAAASRLFRQLLKANPATVARNEVIEIRKFQWTGHVYDFTTESGLIMAGGIIVSNCRCIVQSLNERDLARVGLKPSAAAPDFKTRTLINNRTGKEIAVPDGIDPGFGYNVGRAAMAGSNDALTASVIRAAPSLTGAARATVREVVESRAFEKFITDAAGTMPVMVIGDELRAAIGAKNPVVVLSDETMLKQHAAHPELTVKDYRRLPAIGEAPDLVIQDGKNTLVFIQRGDVWFSAAIKATKTGKANFLTSFRRTNAEDVERHKRRGKVLFGE
ncbi:MAG: hypothetical protein DCC73_11900 [Proteobacteria bacterium]|nr:MAG: hypothetical protein DCC73_11900 [Pseudomonadota bacterium]